MEIDLKVVRALASSTRIEILKAVSEGSSTPTKITDEVGKSKSTVSSHIQKLVDAGLLEKNEEQGRRRVDYSPTRKTRAILKGRKKRMSFSITTSIITLILSGWSFFKYLNPIFTSSTISSQQSNSAMALKGADAAKNTAQGGISVDFLFLFSGLIFLIAFLSLVSYGYLLKRLGSKSYDNKFYS